MFARPSPDRGFSLPEMLLVLAIIMLLVVLAIPRTRGAKEAAEHAAAAQSMRAIHTSQEAYRITHGGYADNFASLTDVDGGPLLSGEPEIGGSGGGTADVLYYKGYLFRLSRTAPDQYTVTAEPVINRDSRPYFEMNQLGFLTMTGGKPVDDKVGTPGE